MNNDNLAPAATETPSKGLTAESLYDEIKEVLEHYRLTSMVGEDGEPYPLVDALSTPGMSTSTGKDEIVLICDAIYNEVLRAAPTTAEAVSASPDALKLAEDAIDAIEDWAGYADDYFKKKHGYGDEMAGLRARLAALKVADEAPSDDVFFPCVDDKDNERLNRIESLMQTVFDGKEVPQVWFIHARS